MRAITLTLAAIFLPWLWGEVAYFCLNFLWRNRTPKSDPKDNVETPQHVPDFQI